MSQHQHPSQSQIPSTPASEPAPDYLANVGLVNSRLSAERETKVREEMEASRDWLNRLGYGKADLLRRPRVLKLLEFLSSEGIRVPELAQVPDYQELAAEQEAEFQAGGSDTPDLWENSRAWLPEETENQLWALPALQQATVRWATLVLSRRLGEDTVTSTPLTFPQALLVVQLICLLAQQPGSVSDELVMESLRSLRSSAFFEKAAPRP